MTDLDSPGQGAGFRFVIGDLRGGVQQGANTLHLGPDREQLGDHQQHRGKAGRKGLVGHQQGGEGADGDQVGLLARLADQQDEEQQSGEGQDLVEGLLPGAQTLGDELLVAARREQTGPAGEGPLFAGGQAELGHAQDELQQAIVDLAGQVGQPPLPAQPQQGEEQAQGEVGQGEQRRPEGEARIVMEHQQETEQAEDPAQEAIDAGGGDQGLHLAHGQQTGRQIPRGVAPKKAHGQTQNPIHETGLQGPTDPALGAAEGQGAGIADSEGRAAQDHQHQAELEEQAVLVVGDDAVDEIGGGQWDRQAQCRDDGPHGQQGQQVAPAAP